MSPRPNLAQPLVNLVRNPSAELGRANWSQFPQPVNIGGAAPDGVFVLQETALTATRLSDDLMPVDPLGSYSVSARVRWSSGVTQPRMFCGLAPFDASGVAILHRHVNHVIATETTLAADVLATDTAVQLTSSANWAPASNRYIAFDIQNDGSDLPNRNISTSFISSIVGNTLNMSGAVGRAYPAGTKVRMHSDGGAYMYAAMSNILVPASFTQYIGTVSGEQQYGEGPISTKFWKGTKFVKALFLLNRDTGGNASTTQIDDVRFYSLAPAVAIDQGEFVHLVEVELASGTVRLNTGAADIVWNSNTYEAVGGLLEIGGVEETGDGKGQGADLTLSGVNQSVLSALLSSQYRGRPVHIYRAHFVPGTGQIAGTPLLVHRGIQFSPYVIEEEQSRSGGTVKIRTRLSGFLGITRQRGIQSNLVSHQHIHPGDTFFQHTASLGNLKIYWGVAAPADVSRGGDGPIVRAPPAYGGF